MSRNILVYWQPDNAAYNVGEVVTRCFWSQMKSKIPGDRLYIISHEKMRLYLLGIIEVSQVKKYSGNEFPEYNGKHVAYGRSVFGKFQKIFFDKMVPNLRFESKSEKIVKNDGLIQQLQTNRILTPDSAEILADLLLKRQPAYKKSLSREKKAFFREGARQNLSMSRTERDPRVRKYALNKYGYACMICGMSFADVYGVATP